MQQDDYTAFGHSVDADVSEVRFVDGMVVIFKKPNEESWDMYPVESELPSKVDGADVASAEKKIYSEIPIP